jgi:DNA repair protein RadD
MSGLRPYQERALAEVERLHAEHVDHPDPRMRRVVLVMPTGAGKTRTAAELARRYVAQGKTGLFTARRTELVRQMKDALEAVGLDVGIVASGHPSNPYAPVQVASLDTLVERGEVPRCDFMVPDECHSSKAETYQPVIELQPQALVMGLTATPQRGDGKALGDVFGHLVVGAQYSELLRQGFLVPVRVFRPEKYLGSDFAQSPLEAWLTHAGQRRGFAFCRSLADSKELADQLCANGIRAVNIDGKLSDKERERRMAAFACGEVNVLTNMNILTEGVDVPDAEAVMLAKNFVHTGGFMQATGRGLRPAPGKREMRLIDLPGLTYEHGLPTADREYALQGRAIKTTGESLKNCLQCGCTCPSAARRCIECGVDFPRRIYTGPKIWNLELMEYFENVGELHTAPKPLKRLEWERLLSVCERKSFGVGFAVQEFEKIFKESPEAFAKELDEAWKVKELARLRRIQESKGLKVGWVSHAYRGTFGAFPSRELRERAGVPLPAEGVRA